MTITEQELADYCSRYVYADTPVMPATRRQLGIAVGLAERQCVRVASITQSQPRILTTLLTDEDEPLQALSVLRTPRYDVRKREAPKRPSLIRRLLGMLR